jgi:hypothetical protein
LPLPLDVHEKEIRMTAENRKTERPSAGANPTGAGQRQGQGAQEQDPGPGPQVQGEGNYTAAREYNEATREFVESGKVRDAAEAAAPQSEEQAQELREAEAEGRSHLKEEDPQVDGGRSRHDKGGSA